MKNIAIVIPCYNRKDTLNTLLQSLSKAEYDREVDLVFSVDFSGSDEVFDYVSDYRWQFGKKKIIRHNQNIGLRNNIISCGDLTSEYDAVIVLEDDLIVSSQFFLYAAKACDYYWDETFVAGISLYSYKESENHHEFYPLADGYDVYFMQWTSSWGQLWTRPQWVEFRKWYDNQCENLSDKPIPTFVKQWRNSWKKYNIAYLVDTHKFYVYPIVSYSTITPTIGTHKKNKSYVNPFYMPLLDNRRSEFFFPCFECGIKYDSFFEMLYLDIECDGCVIRADVDLYGDKDYDNLYHDFYITSKKNENLKEIRRWGKLIIPYEDNIKKSIEGDEFFLYERKCFKKQELTAVERRNLRIRLSAREKISYLCSYVCSSLYSHLKLFK